MRFPLNFGLQYTLWSEEAKAMFNAEFSDYLRNTLFWTYNSHYGFPEALCVGGASWTRMVMVAAN